MKDLPLRIARSANRLAAGALAAGCLVSGITAKQQSNHSVSLASTPASAAEKPAFSIGVADLVRMLDAGVSEDIVKTYVENSTISSPLTADEIIRLKERGVSEEIVRAVLVRQGQSRAVHTQGPNSGATAPVGNGGIPAPYPNGATAGSGYTPTPSYPQPVSYPAYYPTYQAPYSYWYSYSYPAYPTYTYWWYSPLPYGLYNHGHRPYRGYGSFAYQHAFGHRPAGAGFRGSYPVQVRHGFSPARPTFSGVRGPTRGAWSTPGAGGYRGRR